METERSVMLSKKKLYACGHLLVLVLFLIIFQSCEKQDLSNEGHDTERKNQPVTYEEIYNFSLTDILSIQSALQNAGMDLSNVPFITNKSIIDNIFVKAIKISTSSVNPSNPSGPPITISGVLLVPAIKLLPVRLVAAPVPTYTENTKAPSNLFRQINLFVDGSLNYLYFWVLQAYQGFAILLPDYPGYGDSFQTCSHPYLVKDAMVESTIDLTYAAQSYMSSNRYSYKSEILITGYSQGAFVATALAEKLETEPSYGLPVKLLVAGGTPANVNKIIELAICSESLPTSFLYPYAIYGYLMNGYSDIGLYDILNEPYASQTLLQFDGTHSADEIGSVFSSDPVELFTEDILTGLTTSPEFENLREIAAYNSLDTWRNRCTMVMVHSVNDNTVYYENARDFAERQNAAGGNVTFLPVIGEHSAAVVEYYPIASSYFILNR